MSPARTRRSFPLIALYLAIVAIVAGGTAAYGTMSHAVTVSVDGDDDTVRTLGSSVSEVLDAKGIEVAPQDRVSLPADHQLGDGDELKVDYAKPLTVIKDGDFSQHTVYDTDVDGALDDAGLTVPSDAYVSEDAGTELSREANTVVVSTSKTMTVEADGKTREITSSAPTVAGALKEAGVAIGADDEVEPGISAYTKAGEDLKVVRIEKKTRTEDVDVDFPVEVTKDPEGAQGDVDVTQPGKKGKNREKVELVYADGKLRDRIVIDRQVIDEPVAQKETRGTSTTPPDSVWDKIAQCESGGNWSINTGNGYYGGLQFSAATWRSVGGPGLPHQNSREVQIKYAKILQARSGWGQWGCAGARFN